MEDKRKYRKFALIILTVIIVIAATNLTVWYFVLADKNEPPTTIGQTPPLPPLGQGICKQDAKLCPDGKTYVSRTGPLCEFAPCPSPSSSEEK
jgi:hypothetical protein